MAKILKEEELKLENAIENLTTIAEMDIDEKTQIGILQNSKITTNEEDFSYKEIEWLFPEDPEGFFENIKPSFRVMLDYLREVYENPATDWTDEKTKKGIQSMMALVADVVSKLNRYFALFKKEVDFIKSEEFKNIQDFYLNYISKKFPEKLEGEEAWVDEWKENKEAASLDFDKSGMKDFSSVEADIDYELFYIKNAVGEILFSPELIRNIKLFTYFDETVEVTDDLLVKIQRLKNRDMQFSSRQILDILNEDIHAFYKYKYDWKNNKLAGCINKSFMSLMLAANPKIFFKTNGFKSCMDYFNDFQIFLRDGFSSDEYQKFFSYEEAKKDKRLNFLASLLHHLCFAFFTKMGGIKQEIIGYVHRIIRKGKEREKLEEKASFYNKIIEKDDNLRTFLKKYPNGPMLKLLESLEKGEAAFGFDPIKQGNIPQKLYELKIKTKTIDILHLPCPTKQQIITKAEIAKEEKAAFSILLNCVGETG